MTLASLLGGAKTLGSSPRNTRDWHQVISHGVPLQSAEALKQSIGVSDRTLAALLGISEKTLARARKSGAALDALASDRLFRVARIAALAHTVLESEDSAVRWLKRPQPGLGNEIPLEFLVTEAGAVEVERLLHRMEFGVYS